MNGEAPTNQSNYSAAQLRNARRKARKLGLNPKNGAEAIALLTERGVAIDDAEVSIVDNVSKQPPVTTGSAAPASSVPNTSGPTPNLPAQQGNKNNAPAVITKEQRNAEIAKLQAKISKKRNHKLRQMLRRFFMYVVIPTFAYTYYLFNVATPLYASNSHLSIQSASSTSISKGIFAGTALGGQGDSIKVQNYMESRDTFKKLEAVFDFPAIFMGENIDRFARVPKDASEEARYKVFKKYVISQYDTTEQLLRIEVKAPDPETTVTVAKYIIKFAEESMDRETEIIRNDELSNAKNSLEKSEEDLRLAQEKLNQIQTQQQTFSPTADAQASIAIISQQRTLLNEKEIDLSRMLENSAPNQARVNALKGEIASLKNNIDSLNEDGLAADGNGKSLAQLDQEMQVATAEVTAKVGALEAQRGVYRAAETRAFDKGQYLTTSLPPTASFEPIYPRKLWAAFASFIIFFGLYIFVAMTVDVIKEQVSI